MKKNKIIILSICVALLVIVLFLFIFGKSKSDNKYIIQTDMKWLTMHNDGGSHTNIYYEVDFNKNIIIKKEEIFEANLGGTPKTNKSTIYKKEMDKKISSKLKKLLDDSLEKEDVNIDNNYIFYTIIYLDKEKNIFNTNTIEEFKDILDLIDKK